MNDKEYDNYLLALAAEIQDNLTQGDPSSRSYDDSYQYHCLPAPH